MLAGHDPLGPSGLQALGSNVQQPWLAAALPSWRWWAVRALMAQQRALGGRSAAIQAALDALMPPVLLHYDSVAAAESERGPAHRVHHLTLPPAPLCLPFATHIVIAPSCA